jgi:hypothetical protein
MNSKISESFLSVHRVFRRSISRRQDKDWPFKVKVICDNLIKDLNLKAEESPLLAGELVMPISRALVRA